MESDPNASREGTKMDAAEVRQNFVALKEEIGAISCRKQGSLGEQEPQGPQGEVSTADLSDAIGGTSANTNAVQLLDPNADLPTVIAKLNELIQAQRR